jgi:hypothetical protein
VMCGRVVRPCCAAVLCGRVVRPCCAAVLCGRGVQSLEFGMIFVLALVMLWRDRPAGAPASSALSAPSSTPPATGALSGLSGPLGQPALAPPGGAYAGGYPDGSAPGSRRSLSADSYMGSEGSLGPASRRGSSFSDALRSSVSATLQRLSALLDQPYLFPADSEAETQAPAQGHATWGQELVAPAHTPHTPSPYSDRLL